MIFKAIVLSAIASVAFSAYTFPDDFQSCSINADSSCLKNLIQDAYTKLGTQGISKPINYKLVPFTPFWTSTVNTDTVKINQYSWNITNPTLWNSTILSASFNASTNTLTYSNYDDDLVQHVSHYYMWGELFYNQSSKPEPIYGNGTSDLHIYNVTLEHTVGLEVADINGVGYFFVKSYDLNIKKYDSVKFDYKNLYNGNKSHAKKANAFINKSAMKIIKSQEGDLKKMLLTTYTFLTQKLVSSVPASKILEHIAA